MGGSSRTAVAPSPSTSTLILVYGKEEKLHVQGSLRGFLQVWILHFEHGAIQYLIQPFVVQTERVSFVPQDRAAMTDEELAREQAELPQGQEDPISGLRG